MSAALDLTPLEQALQLAGAIVAAPRPRRRAVDTSVDDIVNLACAVVALAKVAAAVTDLLVAQDEALDLTEVPMSPELMARSEQVDAQLDTSRGTLVRALVSLGYLTLEEQEKTDGSAS